MVKAEICNGCLSRDEESHLHVIWLRGGQFLF